MVGTNVTYAWDPIGDIGQAIFGLIVNLILSVAGWFLKLTFFILKFIIEVAGYNGFIDSNAVIVGWVMVRDVTNMFFVVVLLIISFGTILGLEQYEYKKLLVKLLIAAVVVNFSRIICGLIIDVAQVVMITFVNGVYATGEGNLVNMFKMDKILKLTDNPTATGNSGETFLAAVAAITFSSIMMVTMLTYLFLLMARMLTLWILIVLSPLAFVLNVLPQTQKYAGQWWSEFGSNVVSGPIIAFFLWLSFVTVGAGTIHDDIAAKSATPIEKKGGISSDPKETRTGLTEIMTWAEMANFAIAIGMLLAGAKMAQQLGVAGGSAMGAAGAFGKKVAMIASGATAARWMATTGAKKVGKGALKVADFGLSKVGLSSEDWKRRGRNVQSRVLAGYYDKQAKKTMKAGEISKALAVNEKGEYITKKPKIDAQGNVVKNAAGDIEYQEQVGIGDWGKRMLARTKLQFGGYGAYNEEYSGDLAKVVEQKKGQIEHLASTSSLEVGLEKRKAEEWLQYLKDSGQDIKAGRVARMVERREEINKAIDGGVDVDAKLKDIGLNDTEIALAKNGNKRLEKSVAEKAHAKVTAEYTGAEKGNREAKALEEYMAAGGGPKETKTAVLKAETQQIQDQLNKDKEVKELEKIYELIKRGGVRQDRLTATKAKVESMKEKGELGASKSMLLARAAQAEGEGDILKGALLKQNAHSLELNKMKEIFKTADIGANERANIAAQIMQQIKDVRGDKTLNTTTRTEKLKSLIKQKDSLNDLNSTLYSYDSKREEEEELRTLGWSDDITTENVGRRFLSRKIGRIVSDGEEDVALKEYEDIVGPEEFKIRMRQLGAHAKNQIVQGNASAVVFTEKPDIDASGKANGLTNYTPKATTAQGVVGTLRAWNGAGNIDNGKMMEAIGARKLNSGSGNGSTLKAVSEAEAQLNAEILGSYDTRAVATMGNKKPLIGDLDSSDIDEQSLKNQLVALAKKAKDSEAFIELSQKKLEKILAKHNVNQEDLEALFEYAVPQSVSPGTRTATAGNARKKGSRWRRP